MECGQPRLEDTPNTKAIMQSCQNQPGSIILMHDIPQTIDAHAKVSQYLKSSGYTLVTVDELLEGQLSPIVFNTAETKDGPLGLDV